MSAYLIRILSIVVMVIRVDVCVQSRLSVVNFCTPGCPTPSVFVLDHVPEYQVRTSHRYLFLSLGHCGTARGLFWLLLGNKAYMSRYMGEKIPFWADCEVEKQAPEDLVGISAIVLQQEKGKL